MPKLPERFLGLDDVVAKASELAAQIFGKWMMLQFIEDLGSGLGTRVASNTGQILTICRDITEVAVLWKTLPKFA